MITSLLFDYGGTLDADGVHWLDRFYAIYDTLGPGGPSRAEVKRAFYAADRAMEDDPATGGLSLRAMVRRHVSLQCATYGITDSQLERDVVEAFTQPTERLFERNRQVLAALQRDGYRMGVLSNFYGNLECLLAESGLSGYFTCMLDSARVGFRKPDPRFFTAALKALGATPSETLFVGDSLDRDLRPAKGLGLQTAWLRDDLETAQPEPGLVDATITMLDELPALLAGWRNGAARP